MIKLENMQVQNFKNILSADLPFEKVTIIVGENGSGKSNILSAIPALNYIINAAIPEVEQSFQLAGPLGSIGSIGKKVSNFRLEDLSNPVAIALDFLNTEANTVYTYEMRLERYTSFTVPEASSLVYHSLHMKIAYESFTYKSKSQTGKAISILKRVGNDIQFGDGVKKAGALITWLDDSTSAIRYLNLIKANISDEYKQAMEALFSVLNSNIYYLSSQLLKGGEIDGVSESRVIDFNLTEEIFAYQESPFWPAYKSAVKSILSFDDINAVDLKDYGINLKSLYIHQDKILKSLHELSDGTIVLLGLITKIFFDSSDIFFIEEPENSIHPLALQRLVELMREHSVAKQFIMTTHSPYLLNMIRPEEVRVAEIQDSGLSTISKLPDVKGIKKKLAKHFMSFGDIVFSEPENDDDGE